MQNTRPIAVAGLYYPTLPSVLAEMVILLRHITR